jgi:hypothetical protein
VSKHAEFAPFDGDGRLKSYPPAVRFLGAGRPTAVTNSVARRVIEEFQRHGMSNHSPQVTTLWVLITWCKHHNRAFEVWYWDSGGYSIVLDRMDNHVISQEGGRKVLSLGDLDG